MKKALLGLALTIITVFSVVAQSRTLTGRVTSAEEPNGIPGVNVLVKGSTTGTITDLDGAYTVQVDGGSDVLVFSFVGYLSQEITVGNQNTINVVLEQDVASLEEVVIVAYGTAEKGNFTGSAITLKSQDLERRPLTNVTAAFEGTSAGVQVTSASGQPGSAAGIRIRGIGSVNSSNTPLYVVDGVPYDGSIANLNTDDIADITILKDAASAALYGSRAANGVVMITTKSGTAKASRFSFRALHGVSSRALPEYDRVNAHEYYPVVWESLRNPRLATEEPSVANQYATDNVKSTLGYNPFNVADNEIVGTDGRINPNARMLYTDTDWFEPLERQGQRNDYGLSYSGGSEKSDYFVSLGYLNERGFLIRSNYERFNARVNINTQATDWLKTGLNVSGTTIKSQMARDGSSTGYVNPFFFARNMGPIYPVYAHDPATGDFLLDANGERIFDIGGMSDLGLPARGPGGSNGRHVVQETLLNEDFFDRTVLSARTFAEISFLNNFTFRTNLAFDGQEYLATGYDNKVVGDGAPAGRTNRTNIKTTSYTINQLLSYSNTFNQDHYLEVLVGHENYDKTINRQYMAKQGQILDGNIEPDNFTVINSATGRVDTHRIESYFSRVNYTYLDKYSLSGSYRTDGSSKFFNDVRWGNFWSIGGAWRIDEENFFNAGWVDMLKLRASYGQVGNDNLLNASGGEDFYAWQALYDLGYNNANAPGILQASLTAADLLWESNNTFDIGLDFNFFRRLSGTLEYYHRQSENLLFRVPLSLTTGLEERNQNIGSMFNRGLELQLAGDVIQSQDFRWNVNLNLSTYTNEFTKLPNEEQISGTKKYMVGKSIYDFWLREWAGVDPTDGAGLYRAEDTTVDDLRIINGDTLTTQLSNARFHYAGSSIPDLSGGITNTFTYKNFTLSALLSFSVGGKTYDATYASLMTADPDGNAVHKDILNRWQNPGDVTDVPRMDNVASAQTNGQSDRWLVDASYLNFRSVNLSYSVPRVIANRIDAQAATIYLTGENLGWVSARKGMYVSQNFSGVTSNVYSPARVLTLGVNVSF